MRVANRSGKSRPSPAIPRRLARLHALLVGARTAGRGSGLRLAGDGHGRIGGAADTAEMTDRAPPRARATAGGPIRPMLASPGPVPVGPGWGGRSRSSSTAAPSATLHATGWSCTAATTGRSRSYPEVAAFNLEDSVIVDGELVALHAHGRSDFGLLQQPRRTGCIGADASVVDESPEGVADHGVDQPLAGERDERLGTAGRGWS